MNAILLISFFAAVAQCTAEIVPGKCPNLPVVEKFQAANYLGVWYEHSKYFQIFESGSCSQANYSLNADGTVKVVNQQKEESGKLYTLEGQAIFAGSSDEAKLTVKFPVQPFPAPYWVLATDYKNYAVVFSCIDLLSLVNTESVWILTRERKPSQEVVDTAEAVLKNHNLSVKALIPTVQDNCV